MAAAISQLLVIVLAARLVWPILARLPLIGAGGVFAQSALRRYGGGVVLSRFVDSGGRDNRYGVRKVSAGCLMVAGLGRDQVRRKLGSDDATTAVETQCVSCS